MVKMHILFLHKSPKKCSNCPNIIPNQKEKATATHQNKRSASKASQKGERD